MNKVKRVRIGSRSMRVAENKIKYIRNIVDAARKCAAIDRVVLFGSSTKARCKDQSDIDIAVFGSMPKTKCLISRQYRDFTNQLYSFDDYKQAYDILYFKTGDSHNGFIMSEINRGETIYVREENNAKHT